MRVASLLTRFLFSRGNKDPAYTYQDIIHDKLTKL